LHPELIQIGPFTIYAWGLMLALAVILGILGLQYYFRQSAYNKEWAIDIILLMIAGGVTGARMLYILLYQRDLLFSHPTALFSSCEISGLIWYGGVLGALVPLAWYLRRRNLPALITLDMLAPWTALGYGITRIGCYMAGCCYGKAAPAALGVVFPVVDNLYRYPTQLYSAGISFLLAAALFRLYPRRRFPGQVFLVYAMGYAVYRFAVEFFRKNSIIIGCFSYAQIVAAVLFICAAGFYYKYTKAV